MPFKGQNLYRYVIFNIYQGVDPEFIILKFDQFVHFYLYVIVTIVLIHLLSYVVKKGTPSYRLAFFAILGSIGIGALNEIIEFSTVIFFGKTGVGGYFNNSLDLVFNALGAVLGAFIAHWQRR